MVAGYNSVVRENIANNIQKYMKKQGKTAAYYYKKLGVSRATFYRMKRGYDCVTLTTLLDMCEVRNITLSELVGEA